jgi:phospholipid/cholesterol/gamma-HCH transport system permease protein
MVRDMTAQSAAFHLDNGSRILSLSGDWTVWTIAALEAPVRAAAGGLADGAALDLSKLGRLDVAGAYLIDRLARAQSLEGRLQGANDTALRLIETARGAETGAAPTPARRSGWEGLFERIGHAAINFWVEAGHIFSFMGLTLITLARVIRHPRKFRWAATVHVMETAGLNALPIICALAFFIGVVVAYLGARVLTQFGATIFTVELVAFSVMREFGVVITAVLLAGRTDSAFTAELGAMKMRQEIDAMRVIGIDPMEALVVPRVVAMLVMTPLLTFAATMAGLLGGALVCWGNLGISPVSFLTRIQEAVPIQHFWVGMSKAPAFAIVLALVGCRHGLSVGGDVVSLGARTTASVVQAIFLVILLDAVFALWFLEMDW